MQLTEGGNISLIVSYINIRWIVTSHLFHRPITFSWTAILQLLRQRWHSNSQGYTINSELIVLSKILFQLTWFQKEEGVRKWLV